MRFSSSVISAPSFAKERSSKFGPANDAVSDCRCSAVASAVSGSGGSADSVYIGVWLRARVYRYGYVRIDVLCKYVRITYTHEVYVFSRLSVRRKREKKGRRRKRNLKKEVKRYNVGTMTAITLNMSVNVLFALLSPPGLSFELLLIFLLRLPPLSFLHQLHFSPPSPSPSFLILPRRPPSPTFTFFSLSFFSSCTFLPFRHNLPYPLFFLLPLPHPPNKTVITFTKDKSNSAEILVWFIVKFIWKF